MSRTTTGAVFDKDVQDGLGFGSRVLRTALRFVFAGTWGVLFALIGPGTRRRGSDE